MKPVPPTVLIVLMTLIPTPSIAQSPVPLPRLVTRVAFPNLSFDRPVAMAYPDDGSNRLFVVEQHTARIWSFLNRPRDRVASDLFLQLRDPINRGNEEGLLGLAFHPKFKENQHFFVYYSADDRRSPAIRSSRGSR